MSAQNLTEIFIIQARPSVNGAAHFAASKEYLISNKRLGSAYAKNSLIPVIVNTTPEAAAQLERLYPEVAVRPFDFNLMPSGSVPAALLGSGN